MKRYKKIMTIAIVCIMTVVMVACAPTATTPKPDATSAPTKAPSAGDTPATPEVPGIEGFKPFGKRVHITVPVYDRSKEGYPAVDDNYWTRWIQSEFGDKYNIDVEYVAIPRNDVMVKYSMLIAADDTPTILMEYDYPKVAQWANDGAMRVIDLNEFAKVAPDYYGAMVENNQLGYTDINGETYFVLTERPYYNTTFTFATFVRMDWLRKVGYDHVPKSYAEYTDAIDKIMQAGLTDIPPLGKHLPSAAYVVNFGYRDFPVNEEEWIMHSSLGTASLPWEPTYKLLKRENAEYNKGYYSKEYDLETDDLQWKSDFINGKVYSYGGYMSANVDWLTSFYEKNPDAELAIASVYTGVEPGVMSAQIRADNPFGMIVGFSSLATDDELKAAWMLMEWMFQEENLFVLENGIEGVTYTMGPDGLPVVDGDYRGPEMLNHNMNIDMTCLIHASKKVGTIEQTIKALTPQGLPQDFTQALIDNYYELKEVADRGMAYSDPVFAVAIESESEYSATLLSLYKEYSAQLVKCAPEEFDALYKDLSQKYLDAGYQKIMDERLAAYKAGNTTKLPKN
ncbi:MAG: extracellular solute-binding protein [Clostridiaceae bacterium]|nr:extracellular solute-binding protein [Clostridiaceae bacterium]